MSDVQDTLDQVMLADWVLPAWVRAGVIARRKYGKQWPKEIGVEDARVDGEDLVIFVDNIPEEQLSLRVPAGSWGWATEA